MKIGIIGYWYATNYGSACTYYALYKAVEQLGYEPIIIDIPEKEKEYKWDESFARQFIEAHCKVSESVPWSDVGRVNDFCDSFVIGSDQVWNRDAFHISRGFFFLNFAADTKRKVAYAPSFGSDNMITKTDEEREIGRLLSRFDSISVREDTGKTLLGKRYGIDSEHVIDPVFLLERENYQELICESNISLPDHYVLAYILDPTEDKELFIEKVSEKYDLPIVLILDGRVGTFDSNKSKLTKLQTSVLFINKVADWIKCFSNADVTVTDSFHGMSLSLISNKQTYVYANHNRGYSRFTSLLGALDLSKIMYESSKELFIDEFREELDYESINKSIKKLKNNSIEWLSNALKYENPRKCISYLMNLKLECTGCSACANSCPSKAISMVLNEDGFLNPKIDFSKCIDCGMCVKKCSVINVSYVNNPSPTCYAAWAKDEIRQISSSGGVFTVLAEQTLNSDGCVYGAAFKDDCQVEHICVKTVEELSRLRGSKYIQSALNETYPDIKSKLENGTKILFSGMPCQIAGLKSFLGREYENLTTIEILCHGIASYQVFSKYKQDVLGARQIVDLQFKSKKPWGWHAGVNVLFKDGGKYSCITETDPYFVAYIKGLSKNKPCGHCIFNRLPRQGDLTIGDFWKIQDFNPQYNDNKGTSLVLVNNDKGKKELETASRQFTLFDEVPIQYAIAGNGCIAHTYLLHKNRDRFFDKLWDMDFKQLVSETSDVPKYPISIPEWMPFRYRSLYYLAKIAYDNANGRKITIWGDNETLRKILFKYFDIRVEYIISSGAKEKDAGWIRSPQYLINNPKEAYVICFWKGEDAITSNLFQKIGYEPEKDYTYYIKKPIHLYDLDLSKGYEDNSGNKIVGHAGVIKHIVLRGGNNHISIAKQVYGLSNLSIDVTANSIIHIAEGVNFTQPDMLINIQGHVGDSHLDIQNGCRFMSGLIRIFNDLNTTIVSIGQKTTFGDVLRIHANSGKRLVIGKDSMISREVVFLCGDGHSIFDVDTGKNINSIYANLTPERNSIVIGEHVWIGDGAMILYGSSIGDGSIIGAKSVVKKNCNNNCTLAGNPAKIIKENIAWAHEMSTGDISKCGRYAQKTKAIQPKLSGRNVLVIGGSQNNGIALVNKLLELGNKVTVANRGHKRNIFDERVTHVILDVTNADTIRSAIGKTYFDVVFNNVAYSSNSVRNVLSNIKCGKYIQLSSIAVYPCFHENLTEYEYAPDKQELIYTNATGDYATNKRNAEVAAINNDVNPPTTIVRIPYVYPTDRLDYYCESILNGTSMNIANVDAKQCFVTTKSLSDFLVWVAEQQVEGVINFADTGFVTFGQMISYIENKTGFKAIIDKNGTQSPFGFPSFTINLDNVVQLGYIPESMESWFWNNLDHHIKNALNKKRTDHS